MGCRATVSNEKGSGLVRSTVLLQAVWEGWPGYYKPGDLPYLEKRAFESHRADQLPGAF